jgi:hypothetical protein|tara:strand:- start:190 stop:630 length:441 start_codon:yes stop_codon:yes gene_type:complete
MTYIYKEAVYVDSTNNRINCWIDLPDHEGWTPYTLDTNDTDVTIDNTALLSQMQAAGDISAYAAPTPPTQAETDAINAAEIRMSRDSTLRGFVDPVVSNPLRWSGLTSTQQTEVTQYRTDLLNITTQSTFPTSVTWPTRPTVLELT